MGAWAQLASADGWKFIELLQLSYASELWGCACMCIFMYTYIYICVCVYMYVYITESQKGWGRKDDLSGGCLVQTPAWSRVSYRRSFTAISGQILNVSKDCSPTTSLGNQLWWQSSTYFNASYTATTILCSHVDGQGNASASLLSSSEGGNFFCGVDTLLKKSTQHIWKLSPPELPKYLGAFMLLKSIMPKRPL